MDNIALIDSPDCRNKVSSESPLCSRCGCSPKNQQVLYLVDGARKCPYCEAHAVGKVRGFLYGEVLKAIFLFFLFIISGSVYYIHGVCALLFWLWVAVVEVMLSSYTSSNNVFAYRFAYQNACSILQMRKSLPLTLKNRYNERADFYIK